MTEKLIKRFLLEKAYETDEKINISIFGELNYENMLYDKLKKGEIVINELELEAWLENLKRNKRSFGTYLKSVGHLKNDMKIIEVTDDENVSSINGICLRADKTIISSTAVEGCSSKSYNEQINGHLLINGIYDNQLNYLKSLLSSENNSFTIGYYGQSRSEYTKRVLEYYEKLRQSLSSMIGGKQIDVIEDTIFNGDKIYVLSYNIKPQVREPIPVITRHSER